MSNVNGCFEPSTCIIKIPLSKHLSPGANCGHNVWTLDTCLRSHHTMHFYSPHVNANDIHGYESRLLDLPLEH